MRTPEVPDMQEDGTGADTGAGTGAGTGEGTGAGTGAGMGAGTGAWVAILAPQQVPKFQSQQFS